LAEPQEPVNTVNLAFRGQKVKLDEYPERTKLPRASDIQEKYGVPSRNGDYEPDHDVDFSDLNNINRELIKLRIRIHEVRNDFKKAKRASTHAKYVYEQEKKRIWIQLSGGSEKTREAMAEIMTQDAYTEFLVANVIADEMAEMSRVLRTELDALKEISNNQRRQIDIQ
jgi:hypothetical protein